MIVEIRHGGLPHEDFAGFVDRAQAAVGTDIFTMPPPMARPTVPGFFSASSAECHTGMRFRSGVEIFVDHRPPQSIIARLTGGQGAAPSPAGEERS